MKEGGSYFPPLYMLELALFPQDDFIPDIGLS